MKVLAVIPARYSSQRLKGKVLELLEGKTVIQRVYEQVKKADKVDRIIIATDNEKVYKTAEDFGAEVKMTSESCQSGSDRIAEVCREIKDYDLIINVQGDEPFINPELINALIEPFDKDESLKIATPIKKITSDEDKSNPNIVKAVVSDDDFALYFSRAKIPFDRDDNYQGDYYKHIGLYAYKRGTLLEFTELSKGKLEEAEKLEQLRFLEKGYRIKVIKTEFETIGIDTKEDLEKAREVLKNKEK